jgi:hypothetical protein
VLQEPAEKRPDVALGGARAGAAGFAGRARADRVLERDKTAVGEGHCAARRSEGLPGRGAVRVDLAGHVPGGVPALWGALFDTPGGRQLCLEERAGERRQGLDRHGAVGACRPPRGTLLCESTARDHGVDGGRRRERPAPGRPDTRKTGERRAEEAGLAGEALEGCRRRLAHGLGGQPGMGAAAGAQGGRDGTGEEAGRAWERLVERLVEPLLRLLVLTLGTRAMAAGRRETVGLSTAWAGRKAVAVGTGATCADGLPGLEVGRRQGGSVRGTLR